MHGHSLMSEGNTLRKGAFEHLLRKKFIIGKETNIPNQELYDACLCMYGNLVRSVVDRLVRTPISLVAFNTMGFPRSEVVEVELPSNIRADSFSFSQVTADGQRGLSIGRCRIDA